MQFHEIRYPAKLSFGSIGGPERRTDVVAISNGFEERNTPWADSRRRYDAGNGMRSLDDVDVLITFFEARRGRMFAFRWKDWSDFRSTIPSQEISFDDQQIAVGDGVTNRFQLTKTYRSGSHTYVRAIAKPVSGTVRVGLDGAELQDGVDFQADPTTGFVTFATPPAAGARILAGYEFDVPVRFDTDIIQTSVASFQAGEVPTVPVIEVRV